jgi:hypothetical protein
MPSGFYARSTWMAFKIHRVAEAEAASHSREHRPDRRALCFVPDRPRRFVCGSGALSLGESREEWGRLLRMAPGERVCRRCSAQGLRKL